MRLLVCTLLLTISFPTLAADLPTRETPVGRLALPVVPDSLVVSPDSSRLAFAAKSGDPTLEDKGIFLNPKPTDPRNDSAKPVVNPICLYIDDKSTIPFDGMSRALFSPDSKHLAYAGREGKAWRLVLDGKTLVPDADDAPAAPITFSADSLHTAYVYQKDGQTRVTVDAVAWPPFEGGTVAAFTLSPDSKHLALVLRARGTWKIYLDGAPLPSPEPPATPTRTTSRPAPTLDRFGQILWRPDSAALLYSAAFAGSTWQAFSQSLDGTTHSSPPFDGIVKITPSPALAQRSFAFAANTRNKWSVIQQSDTPAITTAPTTTVAPATFDQVLAESLTYYLSPDATPTLLYLAQQDKKWHLYLNHKPTPDTFDAINQGTFLLSPDQHHFAFTAIQNNRAVVIKDGTVLATHDETASGTFAFSPDSKHLAYAAHHGGTWSVCVDGTSGAPFAAIAGTPPAFSPDSSRVAFTALDAAKTWRLYAGVDGNLKSKPYDAFLKGSHVTWRADGTIVTLAIQKKVATRIEAKP